MSFDDLLNAIEGPGEWALGVVGAIFLMFMIARRKNNRHRNQLKKKSQRQDLIVEWSKGPGGQIAVQPWMETEAVKSVLAAITKDGKEARFIGGCVRNALMKEPVVDVDIASQEKPEQVMRLLEESGIRAIPTGISHGTVTAVVGDQSYEITTLRKDIKTDGRHAVVEFTEDWKTDAARRDFTFNTLSTTPDGMIHDYFNGIQDLANRIIRFVGRVDERIAEDRLRILRYFRFIAVYGMRIEDVVEFQTCINQSHHLKDLSAERIRSELFKILASDNQFDAVRLMINHGVMSHILPEATLSERLRRVTWLETSAIKLDAVQPVALRRLAALIDTESTDAEALCDRLKLPNAERQRLCAIIDPEWQIDPGVSENELRRRLYQLGAETVIDLALLEWSRRLVITPKLLREETDGWLAIIAVADEWEEIPFPLRGQDVLDLGVAASPSVAGFLQTVKAWWTEGGCRADRTACLRRLKECVDG